MTNLSVIVVWANSVTNMKYNWGNHEVLSHLSGLKVCISLILVMEGDAHLWGSKVSGVSGHDCSAGCSPVL